MVLTSVVINFPVFLSAQILYVTYTYRNMLYLFIFLMGYYVFSHDNVIEMLKKSSPVLLGAGIVLGVIQTYRSFGIFYQSVVNDWVVMLYTWIMILAVLGCFARFFHKQNRFTAHVAKLIFGIYLFHYVPLIYIAYFLSAKCTLPYALNYILTFAGTLVSAVLLTVIVKKITVLNFLFGLKMAKKIIFPGRDKKGILELQVPAHKSQANNFLLRL